MSDTLGFIIERAALKARVAELQARNTKLVKILADIHELLHPPLIEHDGKTFKFVNPDANAVLEELSSRIRAIPDSIGALPNEQGGHIARLEKDAARYRWLREGRMEFGVQPSSDPNLPKDRYWWCVDWDDPVAEVDHRIDTAMAASKEAPNQTLPQGEQEPKPAFSKDALWGMEHLRAELRAKVEALAGTAGTDLLYRRDVLAEIDKLGGGA